MGLTGSLLGVLGLGTVHEQGEDLGGGVHLAQQDQDGAHVFTDPVLGLPHLHQSAVSRSEKETERGGGEFNKADQQLSLPGRWLETDGGRWER